MSIEKRTVWLVDSDEYLARLLRIKLAPLGINLYHLRPSDLEDQNPVSKDPVLGRGVVIVSLPQPGQSSRRLLARVKEYFPGLAVINLLPRGEPGLEPGSGPSPPEEYLFYKPLTDPDRFFDLVRDPTRLPQSRLT